MNVELDREEVKILLEVLLYALDSCPLESISQEVEITEGRVENLVDTLKRALVSPAPSC